MKDIAKMVAVGVVGYFIGFYELKYKIMKELATSILDEDKTSDKKEIKE